MKSRYAILSIGLLFNFSFGLNLSIPDELKSGLSINISNSVDGNIIYSYNNNTPRLIASNVKLFTAFFGLIMLGQDFRWHTQLKYSGNINNHTLYGNLYIQGGGDPTLDNSAIYKIVSALKHLEVDTINGNIVLDSSLFNSQPTYSMLQTNQYDADKILPSGLIINGNCAKFTMHIKNNLSIDHNLYNIKVINLLKLESNETPCNMEDTTTIAFNNDVVTLSGTVSPLCDNIDANFLILSNFDYSKMILSKILQDFNIKINGTFEKNVTPKTAKLIYDHSSQTLAHVIYDMNKFSNNLYAQTIISSVGAFKTNNTQTFNDGAKKYYTFLQTNNLLNSKFKLENGAGLSRFEYFTAAEIAHLLYLTNNSTLGAYMEASLPEAMHEGTLYNKFPDFNDRFKAKSGTLNDTKSYSGYFYSKNGNKYIVVFIANNMENPEQNLLFQNFITQTLKILDN